MTLAGVTGTGLIASASAPLAALQGGDAVSSSTRSSAPSQKVVVSQYTTTSITGKVTVVTTYSDGSVTTTVTEGDTVILSSTQEPALAG